MVSVSLLFWIASSGGISTAPPLAMRNAMRIDKGYWLVVAAVAGCHGGGTDEGTQGLGWNETLRSASPTDYQTLRDLAVLRPHDPRPGELAARPGPDDAGAVAAFRRITEVYENAASEETAPATALDAYLLVALTLRTNPVGTARDEATIGRVRRRLSTLSPSSEVLRTHGFIDALLARDSRAMEVVCKAGVLGDGALPAIGSPVESLCASHYAGSGNYEGQKGALEALARRARQTSGIRGVVEELMAHERLGLAALDLGQSDDANAQLRSVFDIMRQENQYCFMSSQLAARFARESRKARATLLAHLSSLPAQCRRARWITRLLSGSPPQ